MPTPRPTYRLSAANASLREHAARQAGAPDDGLGALRSQLHALDTKIWRSCPGGGRGAESPAALRSQAMHAHLRQLVVLGRTDDHFRAQWAAIAEQLDNAAEQLPLLKLEA